MAAPTAGSVTPTEADSRLAGRLVPSPNFGDRRGRAVDALILHYTGMRSAEAALARLCDPTAEVSSHYLVWEDGRIDQLVAEADRAWHAGHSFWAGETDLNAVSVGIEIANGGHDHGSPPFPPVQVAAVTALARDVCARHRISPRRVLAHSDIAPDRKKDPGEHFPWCELAAAGVGLWAVPNFARDRMPAGDTDLAEGDSGEAVSSLQRTLAAFGYRCEATGVFDAATRDVIIAFQRHWCPTSLGGRVDRSTLATLQSISPEMTPSS